MIMLFGMTVNAEPIPTQGPSSADTPYYMDSDNILKEKSQEEVNSNQTETPTQANEFIENSKNGEQGEHIENSEDGENVLEGEENPINFDASQENINDKKFKPTEHITPEGENTTNVKQKNKKEKKESKKNKKNKASENETKDVNNTDENITGEQEITPQSEADVPTTPKTYSQDDYEQMYRDMPVPTFTFVHGIDPDQYYDMKDTIWSPYPLLRLNAPLYFKTIVIPPGYYLLTPRKYKDDWYILFKEAGVVKYTIPVFAKDYTPEFYYNDTLPELEMTKSQRWQLKFLNAWGKYIRSSKRKPAIKTNVELTDLDNNFLLIELYYGAHKYSTIFRTEKF